jgi:hypothetical protein
MRKQDMRKAGMRNFPIATLAFAGADLLGNGLRQTRSLWLFFALLVVLSPVQTFSLAQTPTEQTDNPGTSAKPTEEIFRIERVPVAGGAALLTIHARLNGLKPGEETGPWVPLVSILRDTLGDLDHENDRLRYLWVLTYARPTVKQRMSAAVPFLYKRVGNTQSSSKDIPPPVMDLASADKEVWEKVFWMALQTLLLDPYSTPIRASSRTYRRNVSDYRQAQIIRAVSILSLYQSLEKEPILSEEEMHEVQARLLLSDKTFGGIVDNHHLPGFYARQSVALKDARGHNWELLRQRAEAESLYFEPLLMPDGSATHALLWVSRADLAARHGQQFKGRFLNIANPWTDKRLEDWTGYVETRYFDTENRLVSEDTPGARSQEMIPVALYGMDNPKIPMLLVDFRDGLNPKRREMSRRALEDAAKNIFALSAFGDLPYFLGRSVFDFVTGRRGMDINQPSRLRTYAQLRLLLSLSNSLSPDLRDQTMKRADHVSLNPIGNDLGAETQLAKDQYQALLAYASRADGLPAKLERDRREEMVNLEHGRTDRFMFRLANILSFGKYVHREEAVAEMAARLDIARRLAYHTRFLSEVARSSPRIEVAWNLDQVKRSLQFVADHGSAADAKVVSATARIFAHTQDNETRRLCLETLSRINSEKARAQLVRVSQSTEEQVWRDLSTQYLEKPARQVAPGASSATKGNLEQR